MFLSSKIFRWIAIPIVVLTAAYFYIALPIYFQRTEAWEDALKYASNFEEMDPSLTSEELSRVANARYFQLKKQRGIH